MDFDDFNWVCPYCQHAQTVGAAKADTSEHHISIKKLADGSVNLTGLYIGCSNPKCLKLTASVAIRSDHFNDYQGYVVDYEADTFVAKSLLPEGMSKPQPSYIPRPLVEDYVEASLIRELSPKASATLARRCLQGMIRDFAGITRGRLIDEIRALRTAIDQGKAPRGVTTESLDAIDHVREIGNIGAHMEADINHIVDVDPGEAGVLLELIEMLFDEWYIDRHKRQDRLAKIAAVAADKKEKKKPAASSDGAEAEDHAAKAAIDSA